MCVCVCVCVCVTEAVPVCPQEAIPSKSTLSPSGPCPSCGFSTPEVASPSKPIPGVASRYEPPGSGAGAEEGRGQEATSLEQDLLQMEGGIRVTLLLATPQNRGPGHVEWRRLSPVLPAGLGRTEP